jgi:hypothetical protein
MQSFMSTSPCFPGCRVSYSFSFPVFASVHCLIPFSTPTFESPVEAGSIVPEAVFVERARKGRVNTGSSEVVFVDTFSFTFDVCH